MKASRGAATMIVRDAVLVGLAGAALAAALPAIIS
jgi:hypothetical protein